MNIAVAGTGYVGLSLAVLLSPKILLPALELIFAIIFTIFM